MISFRHSVRAALALLVACADASAQDAVARYEVVFDAIWSSDTHPNATPPTPHFSPLVGGTHDAGVVFWEEGGLATQAIEDMAELGDPSGVESAIAAAIGAGRAHDVAIGDSVVAPGRGFMVIEATPAHPLATVVTMVAPSPDWFVGVSGVPLLIDDQWLDSLVVELHAYDAGTDTGVDFLSPDADEQPQSPIAELGCPFVNTAPLGTFTFVRLPDGLPCLDGIDQDGDGLIDHPEDPGCTSLDDASEQEPSLPCDNGADDDGDGRADLADIGCRDPGWATESPQCSDGINNDPGRDAGIDFDGGASQNGGVAIAARDAQCTMPWQRNEQSRRSCGLGFEVAPFLLGLHFASRRVRRRLLR